jgi:ATP-dependent RNA helicase DDX10/DBP4
MKNKKVFDVTQLDLPSFASSLGLAVAPRVRFLQKRLEAKAGKKSELADGSESEEEADVKIKDEPQSSDDEKGDTLQSSKSTFRKPTTFDFSVEGEEDDDMEDLFVGKKSIQFEDDPGDEALLPGNTRSSKSKPKSKAATAKKLLKKNIKVNKKVVFDEEGEAVADLRREKQSDLAKTYEDEDASGIDIEKAKAILKMEDSMDKKLHRERIKARHKEERRKAKLARKGITEGGENEEEEDEPQAVLAKDDEESDENSGPDLSWLPDPDRVYTSGQDLDLEDDEESDSGRVRRKRRADDDSDDEYAGQVVNTSDSDSDEELPPPQSLKPKPKRKKSSRANESNEEPEEDESFGNLNSNLMEELALKLLSQKK